MIITFLQIFIYFSFIWYVVKKYGIQPSISESWYVMMRKEKPLFTLFCYGVGLLMVFHSTPLFFLSGAFLVFTGAATSFKDDGPTPIVHYVGAVGSIVFALIGLAMEGIYWTGLPVLIGMWLFRHHNKRIWWIENNSAFWIFVGLIQLNLK